MNSKIPMHVIIVPDGNRRWAKEKGLEGVKGHEKSAEFGKVRELLDEAMRLGIKYVSMWGFSTENWKRSELEKKFIFNLLFKWIGSLEVYAKENGIRFRHIGRKDRIPEKLARELERFEKVTKDNKELYVNLLLDYGGRDEIIRAVNGIIDKKGKINSEEDFAKYLDTKDIPDPDLVIRTGGEKRLSGLMSFQSAYSELYFTDIYFPDFGAKDLRKAVEDFSRRKRNFGGN